MITNVVFDNDIQISPVKDNQTQWILDDEFDITITRNDKPLFIRIPKGFTTDLASTPRFLWMIYPPFGTWSDASTLHDYLYSGYSNLTRKEADTCLYYGMIAGDTNKFTSYLFYLAVRIFAAGHYSTGPGLLK